jgi:poly-beta-1,6-N-acetyl-D-glucosamine synthase
VRFRRRSVRKGNFTPSVSIVIAARNEGKNLPAKLENLRLLEYPPDLLQIVIASDGSTDNTAEILRAAGSAVVPVILDTSNGKAAALNEAVRHTTGEVLVFLDARQIRPQWQSWPRASRTPRWER